MPYYSDEVIEEVRSRNDIVDVVGSYVRLQKKGSNYFGLCPFHNEKSPSFSVSPNKQMYYCFGCGAGGNVFTFVMQYENFSFGEAIQTLAERVGIDLPEQEMTSQQKAEADRKTQLLEINKLAAKYYYALLRSPRGKRAYEYFRNRAISDETMKKFGLGYSDQYSNDLYRFLRSRGYPDEILKDTGLITIDERRGGHDKFWNRAMFPIMDVHSRVIGFGGRVMGEGEPKYLNSPETKIFDKGRNLYGLHIARTTKKDYFILCEGYMDVIAQHQAGFDNAVASLGTALTSGHANLIRRYTTHVYLAYDSDGAGVKAAMRAIPILKEAGITAKVINMRPHKDPDEFIKALGAEEYQRRINQAENSFLFEVRIMSERYDMKDPTSKTAFFQEVSRKLLEFPEELERSNYIQAVAQTYGVRQDDLRKMVSSLAVKDGIVKEPVRLKSGINENGKRARKEDGMQKSQKLLLTWMIENPGLYQTIRDLIQPEDFTEDLYHRVAEMVFDSYDRTGSALAGKIVNQFTDEEEQREVAGIFSAAIHPVESQADREKALKETILRVKQNSIKYRSDHLEPTDMKGLMQIMQDKKDLEKLQQLHISM